MFPFKKKKEPVVEKKSMPVSATFFTMPVSYRQGAEMKVVEPKELASPKQKHLIPDPKPVAPSPKPVVQPLVKQRGFSKTTRALLIAGGLVIVGLITAGYLVLRLVDLPEESALTETQTTPIPRPAPETAQESEPETEQDKQTAEPFPVTLVPGIDTDSDGLTDVEEVLYQTNPRLPDTDRDGFLDGNEVFHRYNPNGDAPGTLESAGLVRQERLDKLATVLYPATWISRAESDPEVQADVQWDIQVVNGEESISFFFTRSTSPAQDAQLIADWSEGKDTLQSTTKNGFVFFTTTDKRQALVQMNGIFVEMRYHIGTKSTLEYLQTFQMMINSLLPITDITL